ncbi:transcriptional regulator, AsrR family [Deferribacter desulfuricans SSM1]|uniref:Transcriptional regulator, AsrR family n=1 Tax=Deferribacter desulfuricans (strain DSM 14783 / JCM 11476 / NBRC 101012 / SSM1) TaxID=639282 RepID=D3P8T9_DEFDS|nr:metalloregulator ArsR/SmtB family transcription factor [Deferribacter desulfuricans]BAI81129.1 transcriptional regulator, AsrR family [Deferribacter desulfuricans SSM1]
MDMKKTSEIFKSLGEINRLRIALLLSERPMCVCEINEVLHIALSTISAHLKHLKYAGIIVDEKEGRWITYRLSENPFIQKLIKDIKEELKDDEQFLSDKEKASNVTRETITKC